LNFYSI